MLYITHTTDAFVHS